MQELIGPLEIRRRLIRGKIGRRERIADLLVRLLEASYDVSFTRFSRSITRRRHTFRAVWESRTLGPFRFLLRRG